MSKKDLLLGRCPSCSTPLRWDDLLIEYESEDGTHSVFAECPTCGGVVAPD